MIKESWFSKLRYNWSHERCYTDMDYAGRAASGCCGGLVGGDKSTNYLQYTCIGCPHHVEMDLSTIKTYKEQPYILNGERNNGNIFKDYSTGL